MSVSKVQVLAARRLNLDDQVLVFHSSSKTGLTTMVCRKTGRVRSPSLKELSAIQREYFNWRFVLSVFKTTGETESLDVTALTRYRQSDLIPRLKEEHAHLVSDHQDDGVSAIGWIAIPSGTSVSEEETDGIYLTALRTENRDRLFHHS